MGSLEGSISILEMNLAMFDLKKVLIVGRFLSQYVFCSSCCSPAFSGRRRTPAAEGWLNKATALVHMHCNQEVTVLKRYLTRLSQHHSLQQPYARLEKEYKSKGSEAYKRWI